MLCSQTIITNQSYLIFFTFPLLARILPHQKAQRTAHGSTFVWKQQLQRLIEIYKYVIAPLDSRNYDRTLGCLHWALLELYLWCGIKWHLLLSTYKQCLKYPVGFLSKCNCFYYCFNVHFLGKLILYAS